jgi:hypothetical protein
VFVLAVVVDHRLHLRVALLREILLRDLAPLIPMKLSPLGRVHRKR